MTDHKNLRIDDSPPPLPPPDPPTKPTKPKEEDGGG